MSVNVVAKKNPNSKKLGYPDLPDAEYVYKALLGHGMFCDKMPPCFSSEPLLNICQNTTPPPPHAAITYMASRNTNIARQFAIPHPKSYFYLCKTIRKNWHKINTHIGKLEKKFSFCHVRKNKNKPHIFEMNYEGADKWRKENLEHEYLLGSSFVVKTDISICFPSIYTHSIPWAIQGKEDAKKNKNCTNTNKKKNTHWSNDLDREVRNCNDQQTNGLLIGPHASNIVSEIILTAVDKRMQDKGHKKIIRYIDDYTYFAEKEENARKFITDLELALKEYELLLNPKKTKQMSLIEYFNDDWPRRLNQFTFPEQENIGFTTINNYLNLAISLAKETEDFATINYAIKVIASKGLSTRAKKLYIKKILSLSLQYPYLVPLLEKYVFCFVRKDSAEFQKTLKKYLEMLIKKVLQEPSTDSLAFAFYFSIKYKIQLDLPKNWDEDIIRLNDCVSTLLGWKYASNACRKLDRFKEKFNKLANEQGREQDKFWLFLYEYAENAECLPCNQNFLKCLKRKNVTFMDFSS